MRRAWLSLLLMLAACSEGPQADLPYISKARSLAAEWALVNTLAAKGRLTDAYVRTMRQSLKQQLQATAAGLTQADAPYARLINEVAAAPEDAPPKQLKAASDKLKTIEDQLESA